MMALIAVPTLAHARAGLIVDPVDDSLPVTEAPPTSGSCEAPPTASADVEGFAYDGGQIHITNNSSTSSADALVFDVFVNGRERLLWVPVNLAGGTATTLAVQFLQSPDFPVIPTLCAKHPAGVVESPDPVLSVSPQPSEPSEP
jgi:hypothetical protein